MFVDVIEDADTTERVSLAVKRASEALTNGICARPTAGGLS